MDDTHWSPPRRVDGHGPSPDNGKGPVGGRLALGCRIKDAYTVVGCVAKTQLSEVYLVAPSKASPGGRRAAADKQPLLVLKVPAVGHRFDRNWQNEAEVLEALSGHAAPGADYVLQLHSVLEFVPCDYGLLLDYVAGARTLKKDLSGATGETWPLWRRVQLVTRMVEALVFVHARGVVHRDVKPGNVGIMPDGTPKLLDFGAAGRTGRDRSAACTPAYMAPEQAHRAIKAAPASDVWAAGCILFEVCAHEVLSSQLNAAYGRAWDHLMENPADGSTQVAFARAVEQVTAPFGTMGWIVRECLVVNRRERTSATELHERLERYWRSLEMG